MRECRNIMVTGGAGFIGSAFIRYLLKQTSFKGICLNFDLLTYAGHLENLNEISNDSRYRFCQGDICNQELVEKLCQDYDIDTIIHFAAESHVDRSISAPHSFIKTNVLGTFYLLEVVRKFKNQLHFHHVSTDEVYGCLGETGYFTEDTPYHPNSPYSATKASSDHLVRAYACTYGLSTCISNCSNNYGPYQFFEKMVPVIILNCLQGKPLPIYGQGLNVRDWLYVEDHVKALWLLLQQGRSGETYNIGGDSEMRNIDLVHTIISIVAKLRNVPKEQLEKLITFVEDRPGHDFRYAIDFTKIHKELGWYPSSNLEEGLRNTIQWYIDNPQWINS